MMTQSGEASLALLHAVPQAPGPIKVWGKTLKGTNLALGSYVLISKFSL